MTNDDGIAYTAWSSDGKFVEYQVMGENPGFWRLRLGDSQPEMLFSLKEFHIYSDDLGAWMSVAPDNSTILVRDTSASEIYALDVDFP